MAAPFNAGTKGGSRAAARRASVRGPRAERTSPQQGSPYRRGRIIPAMRVQDAQKEEGEGPDLFLRRAKAASAAYVVFWSTIPFFVPQIMFWLLGFGSLGLEQIALTAKMASANPSAFATIPGASAIIALLGELAGHALPGKELFLFFYVLTAGIGLGSMLYAAAIFTFRGVPCFGKWKTVIFLACLTGYFTILLNFIPFVLIYAGAVIYLQGKDE